MAIVRLGETTQTVYSELLDQLRASPVIPHSGSFVSKSIAGATYWYVQRKDGGRKRQVYLGPESSELLEGSPGRKRPGLLLPRRRAGGGNW